MASMTKDPAGHGDTSSMDDERMLDTQRSGAGFWSLMLFPAIAITAIVLALYEAIR